MTDFTLGQAGAYAVLGYCVVFFGLILLLIVTVILGKCFSFKKKPVTKEAVAPAPAPEPVKAPGSAGGVKLYNVEPKTAAMIMAIVADKLQKPINELRFISIKEVDQ